MGHVALSPIQAVFLDENPVLAGRVLTITVLTSPTILIVVLENVGFWKQLPKLISSSCFHCELLGLEGGRRGGNHGLSTLKIEASWEPLCPPPTSSMASTSEHTQARISSQGHDWRGNCPALWPMFLTDHFNILSNNQTVLLILRSDHFCICIQYILFSPQHSFVVVVFPFTFWGLGIALLE